MKHIENARRAIEVMTDRRVSILIEDEKYSLLDDEQFILVCAKTREQFIDKLEAFVDGCMFMGARDENQD
jgi:hypothetical protein